MSNVSLHTALKASYGNREAHRKLESEGFTLDRSLSNRNQQIYFNKNNKKLLNTISGTHNLSDIGTDIWLAGGGIKHTNRFKEAEKTLLAAKVKYQPAETVIAAHSLGSTIGQALSSKANRTVTLNGGVSPFMKTRGESYRTSNDAVSLLGAGAKNQKTVKGSFLADNKYKIAGSAFGIAGTLVGAGLDSLHAHNVDRIKNSKIFI